MRHCCGKVRGNQRYPTSVFSSYGEGVSGGGEKAIVNNVHDEMLEATNSVLEEQDI